MREDPDRKVTGAKKFRILCVEDDDLDRGLIRHALETGSEDFVMMEASNREMFEKFLAKGEFDVVITDFNILGFEGLEVIRDVRERCPEVPVIVVTGTGSEEIAVQSLKEGAEDYIIKNPHHIAQLPHAILRVIKDVETRNRLRERESSLRSIAENIDDGIVLVDRQGCIVFSNKAADKLLGRDNDLQQAGLPQQSTDLCNTLCHARVSAWFDAYLLKCWGDRYSLQRFNENLQQRGSCENISAEFENHLWINLSLL